MEKIISIHGSVVAVRVEHHLPPVYSLLKAGEDGQIVKVILAELVLKKGGNAVIISKDKMPSPTGVAAMYRSK